MSIFDQQKKPLNFDQEPIKPFGADMNFREWQAGAGTTIAKLNAEGFFIGAANYTNAPFKVSFGGVATATTYQTAASGQRIKIASNILESYDSGNIRIAINGNSIYFYDAQGAYAGAVSGSSDVSYRYVTINLYDGASFVSSLGTRILKSTGVIENDFFSKTIINLGDTTPNGAGTKNLGDATNYWNDVSYKTLTDRGCFFADNGVELQDGRVVSDVEAIKAIQKHPTKLSVHGLPALDYKTFPKKLYKPADKDGKILPRDEDDNPYWYEDVEDKETKKIEKVKKIAADGVETTGVISILLGAIKELSNRIETLEKKLS